MNKVKLSGKLLPEYSTTNNAYECLIEYKVSRVKSGNLLTSTCTAGVYLPFDLVSNKEDLLKLLGQDITIVGLLTSDELDKRVRTSAIIALELYIPTEDVNEVEVSGVVSNIAKTAKGINYGLLNKSNLVTTRIYSRDTNIELNKSYSVKGSLISYPYTNKKSGQTYNVCGVQEISRTESDLDA